MFNDRDLGVMGAGALMAVLCLVLPFSFAGRVAVGFGVLVGSMVLAFLRLGPDRIPPEEWLSRRVRYQRQARRYTYQQRGAARSPRRPWQIGRLWPRFPGRDKEEAPQPVPADHRPKPWPSAGLSPVALALDEVAVYPLASLLLAVVGIYLLAWLAGDGGQELSLLIGGILR